MNKNKKMYIIEALVVKHPCKLFGLSFGTTKTLKFKKILTEEEYYQKSIDYFKKMALDEYIFKEVFEEKLDSTDEVHTTIRIIKNREV